MALNKRQRIAVYIIAYFIFVIFLSSPTVQLGFSYSFVWMVLGWLFMILFKDSN